MKTTFSSKVVALCITILLFACSEIDHINLDNEFAKKQEVSTQVDVENLKCYENVKNIKPIGFDDVFFFL